MDSLSSAQADHRRPAGVQRLKALALLLFMDAAVRILSFPALLRLVRGLSRSNLATDDTSLDVLTTAIEEAGRWVPWAHCVPRTLACHILVRRASYPCTVMFGVARDEAGALVAHAWPESEGVSLIGPLTGDLTYTRLAPLDL